MERVLEMIEPFTDKGFQANVLCALAPFLPHEEAKRSKTANELIKEFLPKKNSAKVWKQDSVKVLSCFRDKQDAALEAVRAIPANLKSLKTEALVEIAAQLKALAPNPFSANEPQYIQVSTVQRDTLTAIRNLNNYYLQSQHIQRLAPHLLNRQLPEAKNVAQQISSDDYKAKALVTLACHFPEIRQEVQEDIERNSGLNNIQKIAHLSALAVEVPNILPDIIKHTEKIEAASDRYKVLVSLAPHLPARINREVQRVDRACKDISDALWKRSRTLLAKTYRSALQGGSLRNDATQDADFLNLKDEVNALSDLLLMRDLEPPMAVGILGGWGGGKSYIMHLMQRHMTDIRSRKVDLETQAWNPNPSHEKLSPYVGHIYQIQFDAWTFAKSNLWASLMQTIFFELNRQISLEQQLARVFVENPKDPDDSASWAKVLRERAKVLCEEGKYWPVLYKSSEEDRQWVFGARVKPRAID